MSEQAISLRFNGCCMDLLIGFNKINIKYTLPEEIIEFDLLDINNRPHICECINMLEENGLATYDAEHNDIVFACGNTEVIVETHAGLGLIINKPNAGFVSILPVEAPPSISANHKAVWRIAYSEKSFFSLLASNSDECIERYPDRIMSNEFELHDFIYKKLYYTGSIH